MSGWGKNCKIFSLVHLTGEGHTLPWKSTRGRSMLKSSERKFRSKNCDQFLLKSKRTSVPNCSVQKALISECWASTGVASAQRLVGWGAIVGLGTRTRSMRLSRATVPARAMDLSRPTVIPGVIVTSDQGCADYGIQTFDKITFTDWQKKTWCTHCTARERSANRISWWGLNLKLS